MVVSPRRRRLILPVAPLAAGAVCVLTAALFALLPTGLLEQWVVDSGIAAVLTAAEPPLGFTARAVLVLVCGGGAGGVAWFALSLLLGTRSVVLQRAGGAEGDAPVLRRADAHPDAPARRPLSANRDLGTPFLDVRARPVHVVAEMQDAPALSAAALSPPVERPLPADLDQPLSAYDPAALPEAPIDWAPPPAQLQPTAPRRPTFAPTERMETFSLTPAVPPAPATVPEPDPEPVKPATREPRPDPSVTIHALLDRLERSVARREPEAAPPTPKIEDALSSLRKLATRV